MVVNLEKVKETISKKWAKSRKSEEDGASGRRRR